MPAMLDMIMFLMYVCIGQDLHRRFSLEDINRKGGEEADIYVRGILDIYKHM